MAKAVATWNQPQYARAELRDRAELLMPPAVRVASVAGSVAAVGQALAAVREAAPEVPAPLGPVPIDEDTVRALLRFDYGSGTRVTAALRAAVVADALRSGRARRGSTGRSAGAGAAGQNARGPSRRGTLRVRVDLPDLEL